jgi:hypothetical protein
MAQGNGFEDVLTAFVDQYGLSRAAVLEVIVNTLSQILSRWHQMEVMVLYSEGRLQAVGYSPYFGGHRDWDIDLRTMRGWNTIKRMLDQAMSRAVCVKDARAFKSREHELRWGEILKHQDEGLLVEVMMDDGQALLAECPYARIGKHERHSEAFKRGAIRAFHLRRIDPILLNGTPRLRIILDRESKRLPQCLLRERLIAHSVRILGLHLVCEQRIVGMKTVIRVNRPIPRDPIIETACELSGERIQVKVDRKWH